jgi:hypothetical protein
MRSAMFWLVSMASEDMEGVSGIMPMTARSTPRIGGQCLHDLDEQCVGGCRVQIQRVLHLHQLVQSAALKGAGDAFARRRAEAGHAQLEIVSRDVVGHAHGLVSGVDTAAMRFPEMTLPCRLLASM